MAVSMVTPSQLPGVCHPQHAPPARVAYAHDITLQEVPNGPDFSPNVTSRAGCKGTREQQRPSFSQASGLWGTVKG
ncbi:protein C-ets-1 isoform X1 [Tachysurus ichikawai]